MTVENQENTDNLSDCQIDVEIPAVGETLENEATEVASTQEAEKPNDVLALNDIGEIIWNDVVIAQLLPNQPILSPAFELIAEELKAEGTQELVCQKLNLWLEEMVRSDLTPLLHLKRAIEFSSQKISQANENTQETSTNTQETSENSDGEKTEIHIAPKIGEVVLAKNALVIAKLLFENFGHLKRDDHGQIISSLETDQRKQLRQIGVRFGRKQIYMPYLLKPRAAKLIAILVNFHQGLDASQIYLPPFGVTSFDISQGIDENKLALVGFLNLAGRAVRFDIIDRVLDAMFDTSKEAKAPIALPLSVVSLLGVSNEIAQNVITALGWTMITEEDGGQKWILKRTHPKPKPHQQKTDENSSNFKPRPKRDFTKNTTQRPNRDKPKPENRRRDFSASPKNNQSESPFAILAQLKANMEKPNEKK